MAALSSAIIGAAVIGSATAVYSGSQSAKAAKKASQAQQQSADQQIQLQREQMARAFEVMQKYGVQGDWARNQMAAFLGAPQTGAGARPAPAPATPRATLPGAVGVAGAAGGSAGGNRVPYRGGSLYLPEEVETLSADGSALAPLPFGAAAVPPTAANDDFKTPDQLREEAWDNYTKTPFATIARRNAGKASEDFTSMAGAQGSALSGRTARGMAEAANEMEQDGFGSYWSALSGMNEMGYNADSVSVGAGQAYADRAGAAYGAAGDAKANGIIGQADAWNSALSDVAGWAGWAAGNSGLGSTTRPGGQQVLNPVRSAGRATGNGGVRRSAIA